MAEEIVLVEAVPDLGLLFPQGVHYYPQIEHPWPFSLLHQGANFSSQEASSVLSDEGYSCPIRRLASLPLLSLILLSYVMEASPAHPVTSKIRSDNS